ncbi:protein phosphatase methylesterase 1 [Frankliniella occidentalis]|uniref:Protein phosphatase methylesterase 1 n=1 Tax=Frankliniella occidentalis TaxID=133901 RepID=A0A6J1T1M2_FRAOC|nr:protein phosphatase methylesterase 1 [Frankliniella occidentalis]
MSSLHKTLLKSGLPPKVPASMVSGSRMHGRKKTYTPVSYKKYFDSYEDVSVNGNSFRVYRLGCEGPILFLLHGGGFSALSWALFAASVTSMAQCQVLAMDIRGHGNSRTNDDEDLSAFTLARDVGDVLQAMYGGADMPNVVLMGHSMGGAVAVRAASEEFIPGLAGLAVIDVVEGTAMDALTSMQSFLRGRPNNFRSLEHAIEWCVRTGQIRNSDSARVSMPGQLKNAKTGELATSDISEESKLEDTSSQVLPTALERGLVNDSITEEDESCPSEFKSPSTLPALEENNSQYTWRIDLAGTEKHWAGWFQGLSSRFLDVLCPKMLLLAGIDRLDRELTVGQMQGKFQMQVLPQCGHAVHEDVPERVAEVVASFLVRHKLAEPTANFHVSLPAC